MKKFVSLLLALIMVMSLCSTIIFAEDAGNNNITVQNAEGGASQLVSVSVRIDETYGLSGVTLKIKYDSV